MSGNRPSADAIIARAENLLEEHVRRIRLIATTESIDVASEVREAVIDIISQLRAAATQGDQEGIMERFYRGYQGPDILALADTLERKLDDQVPPR